MGIKIVEENHTPLRCLACGLQYGVTWKLDFLEQTEGPPNQFCPRCGNYDIENEDEE